MIIGKVTGSVVSTRKNERLVGSKFMIVEPSDGGASFVAVDDIGAGIGEYVLVALGSAARVGRDREDTPTDAAIVGIIDDGKELFG
ncbi:MAG: EutN/CcmL family microcompartment protein [Clostridia bacterium]|nr:EutN/CcmL family microcompartment protein [Clostridia bacterium]